MQASRRQFATGLLATTMLMGAARPAPARAQPNIVTIVLDDVGLSDLSSFRSEIHTPNFDRLACGGLRFNRFDTKAVCSTTRAALLTGRNGHSVNFPDVPDTAWGKFAANFPRSAYHLPANIQTTAQVLQGAGYATWLVGKWHLIPLDQLAPGTSRENWPRQRGFDYFYGFARGWTDQFKPDLVENDDYVHPDLPAEYHLTNDLVDKSIGLLDKHHASTEQRPFFLHLALGEAHSPIQVPGCYTSRYAHRYDAEWDAIRAERFERMKRLGIVPTDCPLPPRDHRRALAGGRDPRLRQRL